MSDFKINPNPSFLNKPLKDLLDHLSGEVTTHKLDNKNLASQSLVSKSNTSTPRDPSKSKPNGSDPFRGYTVAHSVSLDATFKDEIRKTGNKNPFHINISSLQRQDSRNAFKKIGEEIQNASQVIVTPRGESSRGINLGSNSSRLNSNPSLENTPRREQLSNRMTTRNLMQSSSGTSKRLTSTNIHVSGMYTDSTSSHEGFDRSNSDTLDDSSGLPSPKYPAFQSTSLSSNSFEVTAQLSTRNYVDFKGLALSLVPLYKSLPAEGAVDVNSRVFKNFNKQLHILLHHLKKPGWIQSCNEQIELLLGPGAHAIYTECDALREFIEMMRDYFAGMATAVSYASEASVTQPLTRSEILHGYRVLAMHYTSFQQSLKTTPSSKLEAIYLKEFQFYSDHADRYENEDARTIAATFAFQLKKFYQSRLPFAEVSEKEALKQAIHTYSSASETMYVAASKNENCCGEFGTLWLEYTRILEMRALVSNNNQEKKQYLWDPSDALYTKCIQSAHHGTEGSSFIKGALIITDLSQHIGLLHAQKFFREALSIKSACLNLAMLEYRNYMKAMPTGGVEEILNSLLGDKSFQEDLREQQTIKESIVTHLKIIMGKYIHTHSKEVFETHTHVDDCLWDWITKLNPSNNDYRTIPWVLNLEFEGATADSFKQAIQTIAHKLNLVVDMNTTDNEVFSAPFGSPPSISIRV